MRFFLFVLLIVSGCNYDNRTYYETYGAYSKYWGPLDHIEVGRCLRYFSPDKNGIACKQIDGSFKIDD